MAVGRRHQEVVGHPGSSSQLSLTCCVASAALVHASCPHLGSRGDRTPLPQVLWQGERLEKDGAAVLLPRTAFPHSFLSLSLFFHLTRLSENKLCRAHPSLLTPTPKRLPCRVSN